MRGAEGGGACNLYKIGLISDPLPAVGSQLLNCECIPASEFTTGKDAYVIIATAQFELVVTGFSSHLVSGKVFNRGQASARNVAAKYRVRDTNGVTLAEGDALTTPGEMLDWHSATFAPSIGSWNLDGLSVEAEATWSKK